MPLIIFAIIFSLFGGTAILAENSVPGDSLYTIKTSINEPVAGIFALSGEDKVEWKERLIERRLEEVKKLVDSSRYDENVASKIEPKIQAQIDEFGTKIEAISYVKSSSIESSNINLRMQAALQAYHQQIEKKLTEITMSESEKKAGGELLLKLENMFSAISGHQEKIELSIAIAQDDDSSTGSIDSKIATEKQKAAEKLLSDIKLLYQKNKLELSTDAQSADEMKISDSEGAYEKGNELQGSSDFVNATLQFQDSIRLSNEVMLSVQYGNIENELGDDENDGYFFDDSSESPDGKSPDSVEKDDDISNSNLSPGSHEDSRDGETEGIED